MHPSIHSTIIPCIHPSIHPLFHASINFFAFKHPSIPQSFQLFISYPFLHSPIHPFAICVFIYTFIYSSIRLASQPSIPSCIYSLIHLSIHPFPFIHLYFYIHPPIHSFSHRSMLPPAPVFINPHINSYKNLFIHVHIYPSFDPPRHLSIHESIFLQLIQSLNMLCLSCSSAFVRRFCSSIPLSSAWIML